MLQRPNPRSGADQSRQCSVEGVQAFPVDRVMDGTAVAAGANQLPSPQHPQVPAQARLADSNRIGELEYRDLRNAGQELKDPKAGDAGQRLVMGPVLP